MTLPDLYEWQFKAYDEWAFNGGCGVIEAVTGSGKSRIAHEAILDFLGAKYTILIIVPTIDLQRQWYRDIKNILGEEMDKYKINLLGGGKKFIDPSWDIIISVVNSITDREIFPGKNALLIADECHHYGAPVFSKALRPEFDLRMGLTATFEREDNGIEEYLLPYFKKIVYSLTYKEAILENSIAHFKIAFIGVDLEEKEEYEYHIFDENCIESKKELMKAGVAGAPFGVFLKQVSKIANGSLPENVNNFIDFRQSLINHARNYLYNFSHRRMLLANIKNKYNCLNVLSDSIKNAERTIVFSQTKESAEKATNILKNNGINAGVLNSSMKKWERKEVFSDFETGETEAVAAPILLDEGINVPSADLAIILSSSKSKRQMIHRMGRVIRKKEDNRLGRLAVFYGIDTSEDPNNGAHEDFMESIIDVADDCKTFHYSEKEEINKYINKYH